MSAFKRFVSILTVLLIIVPFISCGSIAVFFGASGESSSAVGDVDGNGAINMLDVVALRKYILNSTQYPVASVEAADADSNDSVNMLDVVALRRYLLNSTEYPLATLAPTEVPTESVTETPTTPSDEGDIIVAKRQKETFSTNAEVNIVSVDGNTAFVETDQGCFYEASGYLDYSESEGTFTINSGFTVTFEDNQFPDDFNRYTLCYTSSQPVKATVTYKQDGLTGTESFYLEAGTDSFNCLIECYLDGVYANDVSSMVFETCTGADGTFMLCDFKTEIYELYSNDTYYIENSRFKLGVRLLWGGGISYLLDKENTISDLTNLINQADEGRLVQQSYYGTLGNDEYTPGTYNGVTWAYNPVQGGDVNGNHSRIIDIVAEDFSVYIKAQPLDWSQNGQRTPSYMENSYTLYADRIQVDNRFVDFSGWTHPYNHQELPAFYTVSYLDTFTWYDGSDGWTDDTLSSRYDLNFWGDAEYEADCRFYIKENNTETWCSWTAEENGYGIGLYVPNADSYYAGRFGYNASKDALNGACSYVAPVNTIKIVSFEAIEYSYLMTTGTVNEIRSVFADNKDFADNASLHNNSISMRVEDTAVSAFTIDFTAESNASLLQAANNTEVKYEKPKSATRLKATGTGFDVQAVIDFSELGSLMAEDYSKLIIEYMIPGKTATSDGFEVFLCAGSTVYPEAGKSVTGSYVYDGQYHTIEISLDGLSFWNGQINSIRYDYFGTCSAGDEIFIRSITFA